MAQDKKLTDKELTDAAGGLDRRVVAQRLRSSLSEDEAKRVEGANLTAAQLKDILGAGDRRIMYQRIRSHGVTLPDVKDRSDDPGFQVKR